MFPKITQSNMTGKIGQSYFEHFVNEELKCIYHPIHGENDFGIDGYIELVLDGNVTGRLIAVQIKHGNSYFNNPTKYGYKYIGENKHLNYYMNNSCPIFLIIMDEDFKRMNWVKFDINKTIELNDNRWWQEIPKENEININFKNAILNEANTVIDYEEQIQVNWTINDIIRGIDKTILAIPKEQILNNSYEIIKSYIDRMSINKETLINARTSLDIFFPEYKDDSREIIQIPEIMKWLKTSIDIGIPWFYFIDYRKNNNCFNFLVHSYCKTKDMTFTGIQYLYNYDKMDLLKFFEKNFDNLNKFIKRTKIDEEINKEISDGIIRLMQSSI